MIISRNRTLTSVKQYSVLKLVLKWRDYIARIEDESSPYVIPNHIMYQIAKDMPTTKNELRDSFRSQLPPLIFKY
jgi:exosome complex exonuclease RRP6